MKTGTFEFTHDSEQPALLHWRDTQREGIRFMQYFDTVSSCLRFIKENGIIAFYVKTR